ncbi:hypothetical protein GALL_215770 [mine drainage metagenome]|uniref:Uncharacterized protein n=1 Tax=mine drainage metagenome TaxID=410659 RepID=A0A1J5S3U4_9ZZZZ
MRVDEERPRLSGSSAPGRGLLGRVLGIAAGIVLLVLGFTLSALLFAFLLVAGILAGGILWWRTRALRQALRSQMQQMREGREEYMAEGMDEDRMRRDGGRVIEGEVIRTDNDRDERRP